MAALTVTRLTPNVGAEKKAPMPYNGDPLMIEEWFSHPGGSAADTIAPTVGYISDIRGWEGNFVAFDNLTIDGTTVNTSITITLGAAAAAGTYRFKVFGYR